MARLTRSQVARRLGKSIATVRRLEGHVLHPRRDWSGVHCFDEREIEHLKQHPEHMKRWARSRWFERYVLKPPSPWLVEGRSSAKHEQQAKNEVLARYRLAADLLERLLESLGEIPGNHLLRAGVDEALLKVVVEVIDDLREAAGRGIAS